MRPLVQVLPTERPDRCVWGTNWPHPGMTKVMPNDADLVDQLDGWLPSMRCANHYLPATPRAFTVLAY
jgi:predicted TIM-barrel fold metal-dependent hydrolase